MWIEAILSADDVRNLIGQLLPFTIRLGHGEIWLHDASSVQLVHDEGVRVTCEARVHWPVLGVEIPVTVHSLVTTLVPRIGARDGDPALVFELKLDGADLAGVPSFVDEEIVGKINRELRARDVALAWTYEKTLDHSFRLPPVLNELESIDVRVDDARVKVTDEALGFAVHVRADVRRHGDPKRAIVRAPDAEMVKSENGARKKRPRPRATNAAAALAGAVVGAAGATLVAKAARRKRLFH